MVTNDWTSSPDRALLGVAHIDAIGADFSQPRWPCGHGGVMAVTAEAVSSEGGEVAEAHGYAVDTALEGGRAR